MRRALRFNMAQMARHKEIRCGKTTVHTLIHAVKANLSQDQAPLKKRRLEVDLSPKRVAPKKNAAAVQKAVELSQLMSQPDADGQREPLNPSAPAIRRALPQSLQPKSIVTVWRWLRAEDLKYFVRPRCPRNTAAWRKARLSFLKDRLRVGPAKSGALFFSDECLVCSNQRGPKGMYGKDRESVHKHPRQKVQYGPSLHIWACIGTGYRKLVIHSSTGKVGPKPGPKARKVRAVPTTTANGISTSKRYTLAQLRTMSRSQQREWLTLQRKRQTADVLQSGMNSYTYVTKCLGPFKTYLSRKGPQFVYSFLQDGAKIHTSNYVTVWRIVNELATIENHPANSPDLNLKRFGPT